MHKKNTGLNNATYGNMAAIETELPKLNGEIVASAAFVMCKDKPDQIQARVQTLKSLPADGERSFTLSESEGARLHYAQAKGPFSLVEAEVELGKHNAFDRIAKAVGQSQRRSTPSKCAVFSTRPNKATAAWLFYAGDGSTKKVVLEGGNQARNVRLIGEEQNPSVLATNGNNKLLVTTARQATSAHRWSVLYTAPGKIEFVSAPASDRTITVTYRGKSGGLMAQLLNLTNPGKPIVGKPFSVKGFIARYEPTRKVSFVQPVDPKAQSRITMILGKSAKAFNPCQAPKAQQPKAAQDQKVAKPAQNVPTL